MRRSFVLTFLLLAALAFLALPWMGCSTTSTGGSTNQVDYVATANRAAGVLSATVAGAVVYGCQKDSNAKSYIAATRTFLWEFLEADNLSAAELQSKLTALPIKELKTDEAKLLIAPIIGCYAAFADDLVKQGYRKQEALRVLVRALIAGIDAGLAVQGN